MIPRVAYPGRTNPDHTAHRSFPDRPLFSIVYDERQGARSRSDQSASLPGRVHHYAPPVHHRRWHGYYAASYRTIYEPGYTVKNEIVVLETNLYDAKNAELIWSALSETIKEGNEERVIKNFIKLIIKNLSATNLIK